MRRFLSLFLVFLLALRGLAGDAMAMGLTPLPVVIAASAAQETLKTLEKQDHATRHASQHASQANHALMDHTAHEADARAAEAGHHHPDMAHSQAAHAEHSADHAHSMCSAQAESGASDCHQHEGHCTLCGICHSTFATPQWLGLPACRAEQQPLAAFAQNFVSATAAQLIKPPIS